MTPINRTTLEEQRAYVKEVGKGLKFLHVRSCMRVPAPPNGGCTIAYSTDTHKRGVVVSLAFCSKNDAYCKATGRFIATKRWFDHETMWLPVPKNTDVRHMLKTMFIHCV